MRPDTILAESFARLAAGDPRGAEEILAPLFDPGSALHPKALLLMGLIRRVQGRLPEAAQLLQRAAEAAPNDPEAHHNLGHALLLLERPPEAEAAFRRALALAPRMAAARLGLVSALLALGRHAEAETEARACLAQERSVEHLRALAHALAYQQRHGEALAAFSELLQKAPADPGARLDRARTLVALNRPGEAVAVLEELAAHPRTPAVVLTLAATLLELGRAEDAEEWLRRALAAFPDNAPLQEDLARVRWMRGEGAHAFASEIERAVQAAPANETMRIACADLLYRAERADEAEAMVRDGLARAPESAPLLGMLAFLQDERGAPAEAVETLRRAKEAAPPAERRQLLAHALLRAEEPAAALSEIRAGLAVAPHDQIWLAYLSLALRMLGDPAFERLCDFERFVHTVDIPAPAGFGDAAAFNAALAERLDALRVHARHPLNQTLRNGAQTPLLGVDDELVRALLRAAREAVRAFAASLPADPDHPFLSRRGENVDFSGAWSVRLKPGGLHVNHIHNRGWISSAYYVRLPSQATQEDPHAGWLKFGEPRLPIGNLAPLKWVAPKVGRLVLFPSYFWHGTTPFARDDRLTIAFDVVPAQAR